MKKISLLLLLSIVAISAIVAQPRSIGLRLGGNQEVSFQQYVGSSQDKFLQFDAGSFYFQGIQATMSINWVSQSVNNPAFSFYGGFGAAIGFSWKDNDWYPKFWDTAAPDYAEKFANRFALRRYWLTGVIGQIGVEYKFDIPLAISLDYRPLIGVEIGKKCYPNHNNPKNGEAGETDEYSNSRAIGFHTPGLFAFALGIKYTF